MNIRTKILLSIMVVSLNAPNMRVFGSELNRFKLDSINKSCYTAYTTANLNIRKEPTIESEILGIIPFNSEIVISNLNNEWVKIYFLNENAHFAYVNKKYISNDICEYKDYELNSEGFKSFMQYTSIKDKTSPQYRLQNEFAYTGNYGIRQVNGRYCIAIGTAFETNIGTYIDLILDNDEIISGIVSDIKSSNDTLSNNITTADNGCVSEFVVDLQSLNDKARKTGDISTCQDIWDSPVRMIRFYEKNIFN